jgi:hypothetical protein
MLVKKKYTLVYPWSYFPNVLSFTLTIIIVLIDTAGNCKR